MKQTKPNQKRSMSSLCYQKNTYNVTLIFVKQEAFCSNITSANWRIGVGCDENAPSLKHLYKNKHDTVE